MHNYTQIMSMKLLIVIIFIIPVSLSAQKKELVVTYTFNESCLRIGGKNNSENIRNAFPSYNVRIYSSNSINIRETKRLVAKSKRSIDTTYNYIEVDYIQGYLLEPVFIDYNPGFGFCYKMLLKEPLNLFEWKLTQESKTIMDYDCIKATCTFRGRNYEAYFTTEIPFKACPWKFHGLPGVVLEVYSTDGYCSWVANSIEIRPKKSEVELPNVGMDIIDLDNYIVILKKDRKGSIESCKRNLLNFPDLQYEINTLKGLQMNLPTGIEIFDLD